MTVRPDANLTEAPWKLTGAPSEPVEPPLLEPSVPEPVGKATPPEAVPDAEALGPEGIVELRETNWPPATKGAAVLLPVLAAASLYASRVLGDGGALIQMSEILSLNQTDLAIGLTAH